MNTPQIAVFARLATTNTIPVRALEGQKTMISRTMHALAYDSMHDEIVVNSPLAQAILFFRGSANGEEPPLRVIQGPKTKIQGTDYDGNDKMAYDNLHGEVIIPVAGPKILVFSRDGNGDVAPLRTIEGPDTQIRGSVRGHPVVGVDGMNNLIIVGSTGGQGGGRDVPTAGGGGGGGRNGGAIVMFDRMANGNAKPLRVIQGPNSGIAFNGQIQTFGPKGWIIAGTAGGGIGAWSNTDSGDVAPRWKIPVQQLTGIPPSGVAIDPDHKEVIVSSGGRNVLLTFSWPEIFE